MALLSIVHLDRLRAHYCPSGSAESTFVMSLEEGQLIDGGIAGLLAETPDYFHGEMSLYDGLFNQVEEWMKKGFCFDEASFTVKEEQEKDGIKLKVWFGLGTATFQYVVGGADQEVKLYESLLRKSILESFAV